MPDSFVITCPRHACPLIPQPAGDGATLYCPEVPCETAVQIQVPGSGLPFSPLTILEQGAAQNHELMLSHQAVGFSRTEAMQILCCVIYSGIMKGSGIG